MPCMPAPTKSPPLPRMTHTAVSYLRFLFSLTLLEGRSCAFPSLCADKDTPEATREHLLAHWLFDRLEPFAGPACSAGVSKPLGAVAM